MIFAGKAKATTDQRAYGRYRPHQTGAPSGPHYTRGTRHPYWYSGANRLARTHCSALDWALWQLTPILSASTRDT